MCDINIATGEVTQFAFDVNLPGRLRWLLKRRYSSRALQPSFLGIGWSLNLGQSLDVGQDGLHLVSPGETVLTLPLPGAGDESGDLRVERRGDRIAVVDGRNSTRVFAPMLDTGRFEIAELRDAYGNTLTYSYSSGSRLTSIVDSMGRVVVFTYDPRGLLAEISVQAADSGAPWRLIRYLHDEHGDLVAVVDPEGDATRYEYAGHLLTRVIDRAGGEVCYAYDATQRGVRTWMTGAVWARELEYDDARGRVMVTDPLGYRTIYTLHEGRIVKGEADAIGRVREDVIDPDGQLLFRARGGSQELVTYDASTRTGLLSENGSITSFRLGEHRRPVEVTDPTGATFHYEYDAAGREIRSESPNGAVWSFDYNDRGDLVHAVDPLGHERWQQETSDTAIIQDTFGDVIARRFDPLGRETEFVDGLGNRLRLRYDAKGNVRELLLADGGRVSFTCDPLGNVTAIVDELGRMFAFQVDRAGLSMQVVRPSGAVETFEFDLRQQPVHLRNAKGEDAWCQFDPVERCVRIQYFDGRVHAFEYDDEDNPSAVRDGRTGQLIGNATYDDGWLIQESFADGRVVSVTRGGAGEILTLTNAESQLEFVRNDSLDVVKAITGHEVLEMTYDLRGNRTSVTSQSGRQIRYQWDGRRRLTRIETSGGIDYQLHYNLIDLATVIRMPNGLSQEFEYDAMHRMVSRRIVGPDGGEVLARRFTYDAAGRLAAFDDSTRGRREYRYDPDDFLIGVTDGQEWLERYAYDAAGNVVSCGDGSALEYGPGDRVIRAGNLAYEYDAQGRLIRRTGPGGEARFRYVGEGWLSGATLEDGREFRFEYDALGRRILKVDDDRETWYVWDGVTLLHEESGEERIEYLFLPGSFFPMGMTRGGRHYSFVLDQRGSPTEVLDDRGAVVWSADYLAFGSPASASDPTFEQPFRFMGQYADPGFDWYYNRNRYYDPALGRFTCPDPLGFNAGLNLYWYAPNPVNWVDPMGLVAVVGNTCEVMTRCDWSSKQIKEAQKKVDGFNTRGGCPPNQTSTCDDGHKQKYIECKGGKSPAAKKKVEDRLAATGDRCNDLQVDHITEKQCGGDNQCDNLQELVQTVNASFGSQIRTCLNRAGAGAGTLTLVLIERAGASPQDLTRHNKKPCTGNETKC